MAQRRGRYSGHRKTKSRNCLPSFTQTQDCEEEEGRVRKPEEGVVGLGRGEELVVGNSPLNNGPLLSNRLNNA